MDREIKFRGLNINGKWHYGLLSECKKKREVIKKGFYISNSAGIPFAYQVREETVGQFTGLLDKNGKEIYEGDILRTGIGEIIVCDDIRDVARGIKNSDEIIGNIFENIELLNLK